MKPPVNLPVGAMDIGDSFFVPCLDADEIIQELEILSNDFGFAIRVARVIHRGMFGVRVWRIEFPDV